MIVGKVDMDLRTLERLCTDEKKLLEYIDSLVPEEFRHVKCIIDNQRYIACMCIRKDDNISWDIKKSLINSIMSKLHIVGYTSILVEATMLYNIVDMKKVDKYFERSQKNELSKRDRKRMLKTH